MKFEITHKRPQRGLGDTIARAAHVVGADKVAKHFERVFKTPCGCPERQNKLNSLLPYR